MLVLLFSLLCGAALQALIPPWGALGQVPVLLGLVLYYALGPAPGLMWIAAVLAGLLQDALGQIPLGYSSFCFCLVALGVSGIRGEVFEHEVLMHSIVGALAAIGGTLVLSILLIRERAVLLSGSHLALKLLGSLLLGAFVVPMVYAVMRRIDRMLGLAPGEES